MQNLSEILRLGKELEDRISDFRTPRCIHFAFPPGLDSFDPPASPSDDPNDLLNPLLRDHPENRPITEFKSWIAATLGRLSKFVTCEDAPVQVVVSTLQSRLELQARDIYNLIRQEWLRQKGDSQFYEKVTILKKPRNSLTYDCCECLLTTLTGL